MAILYAHRLQGIVRQVVLDLGLTLTLTDETSKISLKDNEQLFRDLATSMGVAMDMRAEGDGVAVTFRPH